MKRTIALVLAVAMLLSGCGKTQKSAEQSEETGQSLDNVITVDPIVDCEPKYSGLGDEALLRSIEDTVYERVIASLDSENYVVEGVTAVYRSKEYIEELSYNSKKNVYFGYTLDELNELFKGKKYVFTLGDDGKTIVKEFEEISDNTTDTILKNVAVGTGVILVCVTVSCLTATAAPAVSVVLAASAKTGSAFALSSGALGGISAGVIRGIETGDMDEALRAAALAGSEGIKWGAVSGAIIGGGKEALAIKKATAGGLEMNQVAAIQRESKLPIEVIKEFHSIEEYEVYKNAGLKTLSVNGRTALVQGIDLDFISELPDGTKVTNLARMQRGYAPLDPLTGKAYQLHHVGQKANSEAILAVLTEEQHLGNSSILNIFGKDSVVNRTEFNKIKHDFWKYLGNQAAKGEIW